jgi:SH3-like domain-containing protein
MKSRQGMRWDAGTLRSALRIWIPLGVLVLAIMACGGFQVRVTPTAEPTPALEEPTPVEEALPPTVEPTLALPTEVSPTPQPISTPSQGAAPSAEPAVLAPGATASVIAGGGLNMRDRASASGKQIGRLLQGAKVTVVAGPEQADNYTWWQVDNGAGMVGWVSAGPEGDPWLAADQPSGPAAGGGKLVNRAVKLGDRVQVTTEGNQLLSIRETPGKNAALAARVLSGTQFTVRGGPTKQDDFVWWQLEGEKVSGWAAEGDGTNRWLTPVEP